VEGTYLTRTEDNFLRQVSHQGQREDKPPRSFWLFRTLSAVNGG